MLTARRRSTRASGGGWTRTSGTTTSGSCSSLPRAPGARSSSAWASLRLRPGQLRVSLSSPTSRRRTTSSSPTVSTSTGVFHDATRRLQPLRPRHPGERPRSATAHVRVLRGVQRPGRKRLAPAGDHQPTARPRRPGDHHVQLRRLIWRARFGARRPPTASTRPGRGQRDANWPEWYAAYMVAEHAGTELPL